MTSSIKLILVSFLLITSCSKKSQDTTQSILTNPAVMAYYVPGERKATQLPLDKLTHIIFSFTKVIDNQMAFDHPELETRLIELVQAGKEHPHLKIMVACGGWTGSKGFSDMATTKETRAVFVTSVVQFLKNHQLDGLDIDWEYPVLPGDNNPYKEEDRENFTALMKELKEAMAATNKEWILTFAAAGWEKYFDHIELNKVMQYANYINLMTYDFVGGGTPYTAHHTNLGHIDSKFVKGSPAQIYADSLGLPLDLRSAEAIVNYCLNKGVSPQQIVIGGAFYGKIWKGVNPENNGLYERNKGFYGYATFKEIKSDSLNNGGFAPYWDSIARAPYKYHATDSLFLSYDNEQSIGLKAHYVKNNKLGGIMFWQLSQDSDDFDLVNSIVSSLDN